MSKAFDKININRLQEICKKIGIPEKGINFITELHTSRLAKIITAHGLTAPININSGIEQGETYSPLLWKIYYDPILTFISKKYQNQLLKISTQSLLDIISNSPTSSISISPLAYMDDTVWHCENLETIQNILNDTSQLYDLNNITINSSKSDLLHIQSKSKIPKPPTSNVLHYNNQTILPRKPEETIRYLSIFYDGNGTSKPTSETIFNKIENFFSLIKYKKLTPSQITSLFNLIFKPNSLISLLFKQKNYSH